MIALARAPAWPARQRGLPRRRLLAGMLLAVLLLEPGSLPGSGPAGLQAAPAVTEPSPAAPTAEPPPPGSAGVPTAGPALAAPTPEPLAPPVDWPELPDLSHRQPLARTRHFAVYAVPGDDPLIVQAARAWTPELEALLADVAARLRLELPYPQVNVVFSRTYPARCPARGLTSARADRPLLMVYLDERTSERQIRAVLAHEMAHHLTARATFVGDGVLTEGIASWAASPWMLAWQGYGDWSDAVLHYLRQRAYVPLSDDAGLSPRPGEDCLVRRDRVYNVRAAFVGWLTEQIGLERVLAMPYLEVPAAVPTAGAAAGEATEEVPLERRPDYRRATGYDLRTLELIWLTQLWLENK